MEAKEQIGSVPQQLIFQLLQQVRIKSSGETGEVIGRCDYAYSQPSYLVHYKAADGRACESWWAAAQLEAASESGEAKTAGRAVHKVDDRSDVKQAISILRSMIELYEHEHRGRAPDRFDIDRFLEWAEKTAVCPHRDPTSCACVEGEAASSVDEATDSSADGEPMVFGTVKLDDGRIVSKEIGIGDALRGPFTDALLAGREKFAETVTVTAGADMMRDALKRPAEHVREWPEKCRATFAEPDAIYPPIFERLSISIEAIRAAQIDLEALGAKCIELQGEVNQRDAELKDLRRLLTDNEFTHMAALRGKLALSGDDALHVGGTSRNELDGLRELEKACNEAVILMGVTLDDHQRDQRSRMSITIGRMASELEELRELKTEVEDFLDRCKFAVRIREGGGPENLAASLATTLSKIDREMSRFEQQLSSRPADLETLMPKLRYVRAEMPEELKSESFADLIRRVLVQCDWLGSYSRSLDGLDLKIDGKPISSSGVESARDPRDIRAIVEKMIRTIDLKNELIEGLEKDKDRLYGLINTPKIDNFIEAIKLEAAHQRERWGSDHDAGKTDVDWLFLAGYLGGKAVEAGKIAQLEPTVEQMNQWLERRLHHIIAAGAAILNWHDARSGGDNKMRPGIKPPEGFSEEQVNEAFGLPTPTRTPPMPRADSGVPELREQAEALGLTVGESPVETARKRLDAAAATGNVEHYTKTVEAMINEDGDASLREGSTVRVPGVGEL